MRSKHLVVALAAAAFLSLFVYGANRQGRLVNTDKTLTDQSAYMRYARELATSNFTTKIDGNRMPLYPHFMALLYDKNMSDDRFFEFGKQVGIVIALVVLGTVFLVFVPYGRSIDTLAAVGVAALTVFAYKAPYFQPEILCYGLGLLQFVLMTELLVRPRPVKAAVTGTIAGLANLTKSTALLGLSLCLLFLFLRGAIGLFRWLASLWSHREREIQGSRLAADTLSCCAIAAVCYFLVMLGHFADCKAKFGRYSYNVNTTFYMWYDSWEEVKKGTKAHGDRHGWPKMSADQIPSPSKYWREHTLGQIAKRLVRGSWAVAKGTWHSYGFMPFLCAYAFFVAGIVLQNGKAFFCRPFLRERSTVLVFWGGYFLLYFLSYAWYAPIAEGNRFVLSLFLPALFVVVLFLTHAQKRNMSFSLFGRRVYASVASPVILAMLLVYAIAVFPSRVSSLYGGS